MSLVGACGDGLAPPDATVLVGQFGTAEATPELLATRAGLEFTEACDSYFASDDAAHLDASGAFRVRGRWHQGGHGLTTDTEAATLSGSVRWSNGGELVTLTLSLDRSTTSAAPLTLTLRRGERFSGPLLPCPA